MNVPIPLAAAGRSSPDRSAPVAGSAIEARTARELAQEFESLLILQMVKQMRETFLDEEREGEGFGAETMTETIDVELARTLARQGGLGLAALVERAIDRLQGVEARVPAGGGPAAVPVAEPVGRSGRPTVGRFDPVMTAVAEPAASAGASTGVLAGGGGAVSGGLTMPLDAPVSSSFGWRSDPFHGAQRFHAGMDFRAAYGREVPVAAPGRVIVAGDQGAYGLTVVVEHPDGLKTRYAHLSATTVTPGQELAGSQIIGRVGQTGRATGPHLHFEVEVNGQRVDPALMAARLPAGLKSLGIEVDFLGEAVPAVMPAGGADHED
jgi:murein DD-endopeptidase MepM/ murein hydrolase activator NlpD